MQRGPGETPPSLIRATSLCRIASSSSPHSTTLRRDNISGASCQMASSGEQGAAAAAAAPTTTLMAAARSGLASTAAAGTSSSEAAIATYFPTATLGGGASSSSTPAVPALAAANPVVPSGEATVEEEEEVAELGSRYWLPSCMTEDYLQELEDGGFLPPKAECSWRAPGEEAIPEPQDGERVILASHVLRGMSLPLSAFFLAVLSFYGLQPHNIAPNSILVLAGFQALCEGYIGIAASIELFQYCFLCRRQTIPGGQLATCGSVTFNCRQPDWYPKIPYIESLKNWTRSFFYCKDMPTPGWRWGSRLSSMVRQPTKPAGRRRYPLAACRATSASPLGGSSS